MVLRCALIGYALFGHIPFVDPGQTTVEWALGIDIFSCASPPSHHVACQNLQDDTEKNGKLIHYWFAGWRVNQDIPRYWQDLSVLIGALDEYSSTAANQHTYRAAGGMHGATEPAAPCNKQRAGRV